MKLIITISIFLILFGLVETLQKLSKIKHALTRKIAHMFSGIIVFFLPYFLSSKEIIILGLVFSALLGISKYLDLLPSIHKIDRKTLGEVYYPLGIATSAFFFLPNDVLAFQFGVLVLAFSDSLAGIVGDALGKHRISLLKNNKSLEGSSIFFLTTLLISIFISLKLKTAHLEPLLVVSTLITLVELVLLFGLDNLLLPVVSSYIFKMIVL